MQFLTELQLTALPISSKAIAYENVLKPFFLSLLSHHPIGGQLRSTGGSMRSQ